MMPTESEHVVDLHNALLLYSPELLIERRTLAEQLAIGTIRLLFIRDDIQSDVCGIF